VSQLQPDTFWHLKKLYFHLDLYNGDSYMQSGLLLQILRMAPELRSIHLSGYMLHDQDLKEWAELAEQGTCMQHLQKVGVVFHKYCTLTGKHLLEEALASCSINCPQLQISAARYLPGQPDRPLQEFFLDTILSLGI
jgi:hypothetical protein